MVEINPSPPVVITRPLAQAQTLAAQVTAIGRAAVMFPLLEIHPLEDAAPLQTTLCDLQRYAMVVFVSPNAIDAVFALLDRWPDGVAAAVVGEGSRAALARHGLTAANAMIFSPRDKLRSDSQTLLEVLDLEALRGKEVLIVRGETGREFLADALRAAGIRVTPVAAYRRLAPALDQARRAQLDRLLGAPHEWIVTSSEALRILVRMVEQHAGSDGVSEIQRQQIIVPHVRIAETAQQLGFRHVILTGSGDEHLLAALQSRA